MNAHTPLPLHSLPLHRPEGLAHHAFIRSLIHVLIQTRGRYVNAYICACIYVCVSVYICVQCVCVFMRVCVVGVGCGIMFDSI